MRNEQENYVLTAVIAGMIVLAFEFLFACGLAWMAQFSIAGIWHTQAEFWPLVGGMFVVLLLIRALRSK